jgi:hypothetical protein
MRSLTTLVTAFSCAGALSLAAQQPQPRSMSAMPGGAPAMMAAPAVDMFLSQTGALQLTDAQVVRLAAIARRAEDRRRAFRTRLDSLRPRRAPGDTARRERMMPPADLMEREHEASHADLRDALAVLTADQQARAWEMMAMRRAGPSRMGFPRSGGRR